MSQAIDPFLKELQTQCIKDCEEHLSVFNEALLKFAEAPSQSLMQIMKTCHSLKGNFQAVGFISCGDFCHELETALLQIQNYLDLGQVGLQDYPVIEFIISDANQALDAYIRDLAIDLTDTLALKNKRVGSIKLVECWKPEVTGEIRAEGTVELSAVGTVESSADGTAESSADGTAEISAVGTVESGTTISNDIIPAASSEIISAAPTEIIAPNPSQKKAPEPQTIGVVPPRESAYLLFTCKNRDFAVEVKHVKEIVKYQMLSSLPTKKAQILGLLNLRGEIVPVINIEKVLHLSHPQQNQCIVICQYTNKTFGFPVESADRVIHLAIDSFQSITTGTSKNSALNECSLTDGKTILILNLSGVAA